METKKFGPLYVGQLKLNHLLALIKATIEIALPQKGALSGLLEATFAQLERFHAEVDKRLNRPLGSAISPELKRIDAERDVLFEEIKRNVKTASKSVDPLTNSAGQTLLRFLTPYWSTATQALNTESSIIAEVVSRYNSEPSLISSANTIGIAPFLTKLEEANTRFGVLYHKRNAEVAAKDGSAMTFKADAIKSYKNFSKLVEQSVNLTPSDALTTLFDQMNTLRKTYHALIPKKRGKGGQEQASEGV